MVNFSEIVDAADHLSVDEQQTLIEILQRRVAERNRDNLAEDVAEARKEFASGEAQSSSVADIMREIRGDA